MTNGVMHIGTLDIGDLDTWTISANTGDVIIVRMGEITSGSSLAPWLRLYGPNGALINENFGSVAAEVFVRATNTGAFIVVAADATGGFAGSGPYRLTLAKTGDAIVTSPGDEGGPMNGSGLYNGTIDLGDLDLADERVRGLGRHRRLYLLDLATPRLQPFHHRRVRPGGGGVTQ